MLKKTLLAVSVLYYADFYGKGCVTQAEICRRTFLAKQTVSLIIRSLFGEAYATVAERKENKREKLVRRTEETQIRKSTGKGGGDNAGTA